MLLLAMLAAAAGQLVTLRDINSCLDDAAGDSPSTYADGGTPLPLLDVTNRAVSSSSGDPQDARGWTSTEQEQDQSRIGEPRSGNIAQQQKGNVV